MRLQGGRLFLAFVGFLVGGLVSGQAVSQGLTFSHLAGGLGGPGAADGTGRAASFYGPWGIATDSSGNVFVADLSNNKIRKISPGGVVTTLAGTGGRLSSDGTGTGASFSNPIGVAVDSYGNVYVTDSDSSKIRKITPAGVVTTLAGSGSQAFADGTGAAASFDYPYGIAVDGAGNLYVADKYNQRIRKIAPGGIVTTLAGSGTSGSADGTGTAASFSYPSGVAVDGAGVVYVADTDNRKVRKITPGGVVTTLAGSGSNWSADGVGTAASFAGPVGIALDASGNLFVSEEGRKVRKISPGAVVTTLAGSGSQGSVDGAGGAASFDQLGGIAVDGAGNAYVAEREIHEIRKVSPSGDVTTFAGLGTRGSANGVGAEASFDVPYGIVADQAGNVYVAENGGCRIRKIAGGVVTTLAGSGACSSQNGIGTAASLNDPQGLAVDSSGNVYVADTGGHKIRKVTSQGVVTTLAGSGSPGSVDGTGAAASFTSPAAVAVDGSGNVFVADRNSRKVRKITPAGEVTTFAGSGVNGVSDGTGTAASFRSPAGIAVDGNGTVFVADQNAQNIRKITAGGVVTTLAGSTYGFADGTGTEAKFWAPTGLTLDGAGNLYVADMYNERIRKVTPGGVVTTLGGSGTMGSADGTGSAASFAFPSGVAVDGSGSVLVADSLNNAVRRGLPVASSTCTPDDTSLCLLGGRFKVMADYGDYGGGAGAGQAVHLTTDTGYFWFFDAANVEAVAKMVSFCGGGTNNVALYAGGLTDLGVTLRVMDTRTGVNRKYSNPLGTPFTLIRDGPFGCPAGVTAIGDALLSLSIGGGVAGADNLTETTSWLQVPLVGAACTPGATTLCLLGGRFQVTGSYEDYAGNTGTGNAVALTPDTGYFWFFSPENAEVVAKMVSFCGSGSNNVGVYAGGLTDIGVTLTVADTVTGLVKSYTNGVGSPFKLVRDGPFSCP